MMNKIFISDKKKYNLSLLENATCVEQNNKFINDVFDHEELNSYFFSINDEDAQDFDKLYQLDIKISNVGKMSFFFLKEEINKDEIIQEIQILKDLDVSNIENKKIKVNKLIEIAKNKQALFAIFSSNQIDTLQLENFSNSPLKIIYVLPDKKKLEKANKQRGKIGSYFLLLGKEKLLVIFSIVAALIIGFVMTLGIYHCYPNNPVYIFSFICSAAGATLNFFVYRDILKKYNVISPMFITGIILNILGIGAGAGIFVGYYNILTNIPPEIPGLGTLVGIGILASTLLIIVSILIAIIIKKLLKKK